MLVGFIAKEKEWWLLSSTTVLALIYQNGWNEQGGVDFFFILHVIKVTAWDKEQYFYSILFHILSSS